MKTKNVRSPTKVQSMVQRLKTLAPTPESEDLANEPDIGTILGSENGKRWRKFKPCRSTVQKSSKNKNDQFYSEYGLLKLNDTNKQVQVNYIHNKMRVSRMMAVNCQINGEFKQSLWINNEVGRDNIHNYVISNKRGRKQYGKLIQDAEESTKAPTEWFSGKKESTAVLKSIDFEDTRPELQGSEVELKNPFIIKTLSEGKTSGPSSNNDMFRILRKRHKKCDQKERRDTKSQKLITSFMDAILTIKEEKKKKKKGRLIQTTLK